MEAGIPESLSQWLAGDAVPPLAGSSTVTPGEIRANSGRLGGGWCGVSFLCHLAERHLDWQQLVNHFSTALLMKSFHGQQNINLSCLIY